MERNEATEDTAVREVVASLRDTPDTPSPVVETVTPIFSRAMASAEVTNVLMAAMEEVRESGATSSTPTIPAPT